MWGIAPGKGAVIGVTIQMSWQWLNSIHLVVPLFDNRPQSQHLKLGHARGHAEESMLITRVDNRGDGPAGFWLASDPMYLAPYRHRFETSFTQKAWNTRSFLVLSQLERRALEHPNG